MMRSELNNMNGSLSPTPPDPAVNVVGGTCQGGTYVLRIAVRKDLNLAFGHFKRGKLIHVLAGEYAYVGSALSERGSTCLERRLLRHASRTASKPHNIRPAIARYFAQADQPSEVAAKNLRWQIDSLLDLHDVELVAVYAIRSKLRLEASVGRLLEADPATSVIERGLGASDLPGNTHFLRVDAGETWWGALSKKLLSLATVAKK